MPSDSTSFLLCRVRRRDYRPIAVASAALGTAFGALLFAGPASAFTQQTSVEGPIGTDIGGVWLSVQQIIPEFRIQIQHPDEGRPVPFKVGPIPAELGPVTGKHPKGVSITELTDAAKCSDYGIFLGDIVMKVGTTEVTDPAAFEKGLESLPKSILLTIRRPLIKMTTARLMKIKYSATKDSTQTISAVAGDTADIQILDVKLPFAEALEATRQSHEFWQPKAADIKSLTDTWFTLPPNDPLLFMKGKHRLVAAGDYDESLSADETLKTAKHGLLMDLEANPGRGSGGKNIDIYAFESMTPQRIEGGYVTATIAAAPFPINVEFKGRFVMTKIADWSDKDDQERKAAEAAKKPKEDLKAYKLTPDVPPTPAKPSAPAAP